MFGFVKLLFEHGLGRIVVGFEVNGETIVFLGFFGFPQLVGDQAEVVDDFGVGG